MIKYNINYVISDIGVSQNEHGSTNIRYTLFLVNRLEVWISYLQLLYLKKDKMCLEVLFSLTFLYIQISNLLNFCPPNYRFKFEIPKKKPIHFRARELFLHENKEKRERKKGHADLILKRPYSVIYPMNMHATPNPSFYDLKPFFFF